ncbi:early nodulin-55-2 [Nymphaea colorata]|nr:early nodulin-55-2 [Nymphaea colorata]
MSPMATASLVLYFLLFCLLPIPLSSAETYIVGGSTGWTTGVANYSAWAASHTLHVGNTLVFRYELQRHNVYIFHHKSAFQTCNFTHATMLDRGDTGYFKWTATRPGIFYFSCNGPIEKGGSTTHCQRGQKIAVLVYGKPHEGFHGVAPALSPSYAPSPKDQRLKIPKRAGSLARSPSKSPRASTWAAPGSSPSPSPVPMPPVLPDFSKGIPFISSNPALPLPKGETDAATIRPLPTSGGEGQAVGWREIQILLLGLLLYSVTVLHV